MNRSTSVRRVWRFIEWRQLPHGLLHTAVGWIWMISGGIWLWLLVNILSIQEGHHHHHMVTQVNGFFPQVSHWILMLIAMMFPLLMVQINHVAFASPRFRRYQSVMLFLSGYSGLWLVFATVFWGAQAAANALGIDHGIYPIIGVSCFVLAALLVWSKNHPIVMASCNATKSLSIQGWRANMDCLLYGLKTAQNCIRSCGLPMLALMLTGHDFMLMFLVTLALWYERYCLPHLSKQMSVWWGLLAGITIATTLL
ncbi:DUF2182 domain-containing protein [Shewanella sp. YLB-07]|uniref:copper chaperone n=1 Tax=Shewanella sp. YLB-07 TaxID=2601268 RepID=UPI001883A4C3|nr:DUF2182 domain-containing protein [Shewanella sp. YLB-07]